MDTPVELEVGQAVDRFRIEGVLGRGGMATVYLARHAHLDTLHAIKVLDMTGAGLHRRLLLEGRTQATLRHPNIVAVSDVVEVGRWLGLVMDFVRGPTLAARIDHGPIPLRQAHELGVGVLAGVGAAHAMGVVHRDLKPANILLELAAVGARVTPKITDFGLAKASASDLRHTRTGATMGTPPYMAPEQVLDASDVDLRCDVFALGAIFYELLTGVVAFERGSAFETMQAVSRGERRPLAELRPGLPPEMIEAVDSALMVDRSLRCPDVETFAARWAAARPAGEGPVWAAESIDLLTQLAPATRLFSDAGRRDALSVAAVSLSTTAPSQGTWQDDEPAPSLVEELVVPPAPGVAPTPAAPVAPTLPGPLRALVVVAVVLGAVGLAAGRWMPVAQPLVAPPAAVAPTEPAPAPVAAVLPAADLEPAAEAPSPTAPPAAPSAPRVEELEARPAPTPKAPALSPSGKPVRAPEAEAPAVAPEAAPAPPPAEAPRPTPSPAPAAPTTARVRLAGDAKTVWLRSDRGNFLAGRDPVPPGTFHVYAFFAGDTKGVRVLDLTVAAGDTVTLDCDQEQARCRVR